MKNILIDEIFFTPTSSKSGGLISGLKRLSLTHNLFVNNKSKINELVRALIELENIALKDSSGFTGAFDYLITTVKSGKNNSVIVGSKNKIRTFAQAVDFIIRKQRSAKVQRKTKETEIKIELELDGDGKSKIHSGIGFFDHMLEQIARHSNINLFISVKGDLHIDEHHTIEDTGIALGVAIRNALGDKLGIKRYGYFLPMDDAIANCALDFGGRSYLNFNCKFTREKVGDFPTELTEEFFRGLSSGLAANLYLKATGKNDHHKIEAMFKAFAKSLNEACRIDERAKNSLPSTKGLL